MEWMEAIRAVLDTAHADETNPGTHPAELDSDTAAELTLSAPATGTINGESLKIDPAEPIVKANWFAKGDWVSVTPTDVGKIPQVGRLVGITAETVSIIVRPTNNSQQSSTMHFPRLGFTVTKATDKA